MTSPAHSRLAPSIALALCYQAMSLQAAPPANDNLASAPILHFSSTAAESSTTVDATMEVAEPFPDGYSDSAANYQGTVWWSWTPNTVNTGGAWYELETTGSAVNTVMSLWTGSNVGSLAPVHVNDDNIAVPADGTISRIRFFAPKDVTYRIAVASRTATRGVVQLKGALAFPTPFSIMTAATLTPSPANVASPVTLTADVTLSSTSEITSGLISLYNPSNAVIATATVSGAANRISGNVSNGVYRMTLNIPQGSPVGSCRWGIHVKRSNSAYCSYGWEGVTPLPAGVPTAITVINDSYAAWLTANSMTGPDSLREADYDGDGVKNLIEFASGTDPLAGSQTYLEVSGNTITHTGLPSITNQGGVLRVEFVRRLNDSSVIYTVQFSDDLVNWDPATGSPTVIATNSNYEVVRVDDSSVKTRRFGRVRVTQ